MGWTDESQQLAASGFTPEEIAQEANTQRTQMVSAGFKPEEADKYFGINNNPDMAQMKDFTKANLQKSQEEEKPNPDVGIKPQPKQADGMIEAIEAGWQTSVTGLLTGRPTITQNPDASRMAKIASTIGQLAGDIPAMLAGAESGAYVGAPIGGLIGSAVGPIGTLGGIGMGVAAGAAAGAFSAPAGMRKALMDHYEKGDIKNASDFVDRSLGIAWESTKGAVTGAATSLVGGPISQPFLKTVAELVTMTSVASALDGHLPDADDFINNALLLGTVHGVTTIAPKLRAIYAENGMRPEQVIDEANRNPVLKQELLSSNSEIPKIQVPSLDEQKALGLDPIPEPPKQEPIEVPKNAEAFKPLDVFAHEENEVPEKIPGPPSPPETSGAEEPSERSEAVQSVLDRIGKPEEEGSAPFKERVKALWDEGYRRYVDRLDPILKAIQAVGVDPKDLKATENPYKLARLFVDNASKSEVFFQSGPFEYGTLKDTGTRGLDKILGDIPDNEKEDFKAFAMSKRAIELSDRKIETGIPLDKAQEVVKQLSPKFEKLFQETVKFQNDTLSYLKDSGFIDSKALGAMKEMNKSYIPFFRIMDEEGSSGGGIGSGPKNIEGSTRQFVDPIESMYLNTQATIRMAEANRAKLSFVDLMKKTDTEGEFLKLKKTPLNDEQLTKVKDFLDTHNLKGEIDPSNLSMFTPDASSKNSLEVFRNGKRETYEVSPEVKLAYDTFQGAPQTANVVMKFAKAMATGLRFGTSITPDFQIKNFIRDQITSGSLSEYGSAPVDSVMAVKEFLPGHATEAYDQWLKSGGARATFARFDADYIQSHVYELNKETGFINGAWNTVKNKFQMLQVAAEIAEKSTRMAEFKNALKGIDNPNIDQIFDAGFASREVTVDFGRMGANTQAWNAISAFFNIGIQGPDRVRRAFVEDPVGMSVKVGTFLTAPSMLLLLSNYQDPRWKDIPNWQKDLSWIVFTNKWEKSDWNDASARPEGMKRQAPDGSWEVNNGHTFRIPKPQELGLIFASLPERVLEHFLDKNSGGIADLAKSTLGTLVPNMMPTAASPILEQWANKSFFTGSQLVPSQLEKVAPAYQYTEYTSETAKGLGKMLGALPYIGESSFSSPMVLDNYVQAWSGNVGKYAVQLADKGLEKAGIVPEKVKPVSTLADIPFIKAFVVRYPQAKSQSVVDFYDRESQSDQLVNTVKSLISRGEVQDAMKMAGGNIDMLMRLDGIKDGIGAQNNLIQKIMQNDQIKSEDKRKLIDSAYYQMSAAAQMGNKMFRQLDDYSKQKAK